jgi:hypothetical protein
VSGETIRLSASLRLAVDSLHAMYVKDKQMQIFNSIFDLLWAGRGLLSKLCSFFRVPCAKKIEKHEVTRLKRLNKI